MYVCKHTPLIKILVLVLPTTSLLPFPSTDAPTPTTSTDIYKRPIPILSTERKKSRRQEISTSLLPQALGRSHLGRNFPPLNQPTETTYPFFSLPNNRPTSTARLRVHYNTHLASPSQPSLSTTLTHHPHSSSYSYPSSSSPRPRPPSPSSRVPSSSSPSPSSPQDCSP